MFSIHLYSYRISYISCWSCCTDSNKSNSHECKALQESWKVWSRSFQCRSCQETLKKFAFHPFNIRPRTCLGTYLNRKQTNKQTEINAMRRIININNLSIECLRICSHMFWIYFLEITIVYPQIKCTDVSLWNRRNSRCARLWDVTAAYPQSSSVLYSDVSTFYLQTDNNCEFFHFNEHQNTMFSILL